MKTPPKTPVECPSCKHQFMVSLRAMRCLRCGHRWVPRQWDVRQCPSCRSLRWDEPREGAPATEAEPRPGSGLSKDEAPAIARASVPRKPAGAAASVKMAPAAQGRGMSATDERMVAGMSLEELVVLIPQHEHWLSQIDPTSHVHAEVTKKLEAMRTRRDALAVHQGNSPSSG